MGVGEHFFTFCCRRYQVTKNDDSKMTIPKGYVVVMVGHEDKERKRFIIPVLYMNHPLFMNLLKEAEEKFGFHHRGPINIPCHVREFSNVQGMILQDYNHPYHHPRYHMCCFID
ncbi:small auxin-up RNA [Artemisia annua]|uniref:Small auxin-up RNA n=1 Tax=Artemisia annua TaxID=35608 RepID=A0A2U1L0J8_ARTAN|nr:small auxin-up RNA [Artemisia annua]